MKQKKHPPPGVPNNIQIRQLNAKEPINQHKNELVGRGHKRKRISDQKGIEKSF